VIELVIEDEGRAHPLSCEAVLFDMDGTLVDSRACVEACWRRWAERHSLDVDALLAQAHGRQNQDLIRLVAPHLDTPEELEGLVRAEEACRDGIVAIPGAGALLARLPRPRWALVTSAWRVLAEIRMACAGLPLPDVLVPAEESPRGKPHPDGYLIAAHRLGVRPERCVVFEDAPAGVAAGKAAGMTVVGLRTTFDRQRLGCALCVPDFRAVRLTPARAA
jgi:sugar-phosphatase